MKSEMQNKGSNNKKIAGVDGISVIIKTTVANQHPWTNANKKDQCLTTKLALSRVIIKNMWHFFLSLDLSQSHVFFYFIDADFFFHYFKEEKKDLFSMQRSTYDETKRNCR